MVQSYNNEQSDFDVNINYKDEPTMCDIVLNGLIDDQPSVSNEAYTNN